MQHFPHVPHYVRLASNSATVGLTLSRADRLGVILVAVSLFFFIYFGLAPYSAAQRQEVSELTGRSAVRPLAWWELIIRYDKENYVPVMSVPTRLFVKNIPFNKSSPHISPASLGPITRLPD